MITNLMMTDPLLTPNTLWSRTLAATQHGLACGALQPIATDSELVVDAGIPFVVRIAANILRKARAGAERKLLQGEAFNPFLPYDPDLFVADLSPTHVCILNKFNVVDHHLLMITRAFESQDSLLTVQDFEAMGLTLREIDGLAFYNGGKLAGASQRHKHLQLVPLPMVPEGPALPMEAVFNPREFRAGLNQSALPFHHAIAPLNFDWNQDLTAAAQGTLNLYKTMLKALDLWSEDLRSEDLWSEDLRSESSPEGDRLQPRPYNLLATRDWLLIIPRRAEASAGISINSLGFAGSLFVKDAEQLAQLKAIGPMNILKAVVAQ